MELDSQCLYQLDMVGAELQSCSNRLCHGISRAVLAARGMFSYPPVTL